MRVSKLFEPIFAIDSPKEKLKAILDIPFSIPKTDYAFWKLIYALKWQREEYDGEMSETIEKILLDIYTQLNSENPKAEAQLIMMLFDGIATSLLLKGINHQNEIKNLIYKKSNLL